MAKYCAKGSTLNWRRMLLYCILYQFSPYCITASTHLDRSPVASFSEPILLSSLDRDGNFTAATVPLFYGWFFNESVAESMSIIGKKFFIEAYDNIPQFQVFIHDLMQEKNVTNPLEYFVKPLDPDSQLPDLHYHTTAKFCGRNDSAGECTLYLKDVGQYLGRPYKIHMVGLFFTPKTYGIRVKLTPQEQKLFRGDVRENSAQAAILSDDNNEIEQPIVARTDQGGDFMYEPYYKTKDQGGHPHPYYPGITFRPQKESFHPTESRAHVSLGCAPKIDAVQTGLDLLEIIDLEVSSYSYYQDYSIGGTEIPKATLRQYKVYDERGSRAFVIYPEEEMIAGALFDAYL